MIPRMPDATRQSRAEDSNVDFAAICPAKIPWHGTGVDIVSMSLGDVLDRIPD
jgi:hypothetical protein